MAIAILGEDFQINHQTERSTAMGRIKVVNRDDVHKDFDRILEGVCDKVKGMVELVLTGAREELAKELRGIGLMVIILGCNGTLGNRERIPCDQRLSTNPDPDRSS